MLELIDIFNYFPEQALMIGGKLKMWCLSFISKIKFSFIFYMTTIISTFRGNKQVVTPQAIDLNNDLNANHNCPSTIFLKICFHLNF